MDWGYPVGEGPSEEIPGPFRFSGKASEIPPVLLFKKVGKELLLHDLIRPDRLIRSQDRKSDRSRQQVGKLKTQVIGLLVYKHHIERIPSPFIPVFSQSLRNSLLSSPSSFLPRFSNRRCVFWPTTP